MYVNIKIWHVVLAFMSFIFLVLGQILFKFYLTGIRVTFKDSYSNYDVY